MEKFTTLEGVAAPLKFINVDTRHDDPEAIPENHQAHGPRQGTFLGAALQG